MEEINLLMGLGGWRCCVVDPPLSLFSLSQAFFSFFFTTVPAIRALMVGICPIPCRNRFFSRIYITRPVLHRVYSRGRARSDFTIGSLSRYMSDEQPLAVAAPPPSTDDALIKYKKLLSVARQSLEANQKKLGEKDKILEQLSAQVEQLARQKEQLVQALENELTKSKSNVIGDDDVNTKPCRILRRVDVADQIWLLFAYPDSPSSWSTFGNEQEARDFVSRLSGEPLQIPHRCFTPEESSILVLLYL